jgi:hypothetical protein
VKNLGLNCGQNETLSQTTAQGLKGDGGMVIIGQLMTLVRAERSITTEVTGELLESLETTTSAGASPTVIEV